jgi:outer membrane lipoprotein SlyB
VYVAVRALKSLNVALVNSGTLQGVVVGRVIAGSGLTGLDDPTVGGGAITTCAKAWEPNASAVARNKANLCVARKDGKEIGPKVLLHVA